MFLTMLDTMLRHCRIALRQYDDLKPGMFVRETRIGRSLDALKNAPRLDVVVRGCARRGLAEADIIKELGPDQSGFSASGLSLRRGR